MSGIDYSIIGKKFNMLTVREFDHTSERSGTYWLCDCECGRTTVVSRHNLNNLSIVSCGCYGESDYRKKLAYENKKKNIGKKYGRLTVKDYVPGDGYFCECECTNTIYATEPELENGYIVSCGCFRRNRLAYGENAFNRLYGTYKGRMIKRGLEFSLTKDEFRELTKQNCFYCNVEPKQIATSTGRSYGEYIYNGIDRIDSSKGYTKDNVVPCCGFCNVAKNNYAQDFFVNKIESIYNNLKEKEIIK
jgi:hypothetical protein